MFKSFHDVNIPLLKQSLLFHGSGQDLGVEKYIIWSTDASLFLLGYMVGGATA